ncbi:MAG: clostripain-related cysteine peptidase [Candidatus Wallbacteria bacterium]|nr:clostripain-related cysteine peptidase [Candidatus Wallbacteria bacterium]
MLKLRSIIIFMIILRLAGQLSAEGRAWTVFVYMNGDCNLEGATFRGLNQLEKVGSNDWMDMVALVDRIPGENTSNGDWTGGKVFHVIKDTDTTQVGDDGTVISPVLEDIAEPDMGDPATLTGFVKKYAAMFPAEKYCLIIWGHGHGWKPYVYPPKSRDVCSDDTDRDTLTLAELKSAFSEITDSLGKKIDVLDFDACLMGMLEVAYQFKDSVDYLAYSEEIEPDDGDPLCSIFSSLTPEAGGRDLALLFAEKYCSFYPAKWYDVTKSAIDESRIRAVESSIADLALELTGNMGKFKTALAGARHDSLWFSESDYIDLGFFLQLLEKRCNSDDVLVEKIQAARFDYGKAVIYGGHVGDENEDATGMSIYFPETGNRYLKSYEDLPFSKTSGWDRLLQEYYK